LSENSKVNHAGHPKNYKITKHANRFVKKTQKQFKDKYAPEAIYTLIILLN